MAVAHAFRSLWRSLTSANAPKPISAAASVATAEALNSRMGEGLTKTLGFRVDSVTHDESSVPTVHSSMEVTPAHLAPNGFCHAASIIALADSACGAGAYLTLPAGVESFTTATLMSSHIGTARSGRVSCSAVGTHLGRTTQVWDATVKDPKGKRIAMLRVTQILLRPKQ